MQDKINYVQQNPLKSVPTKPEGPWIIKHSTLLDGTLHIKSCYCSYTWAAQLIR
jgi:hypothetical protein